jgi:TRAP-type C4-dicarboxylate transport system, large permease component
MAHGHGDESAIGSRTRLPGIGRLILTLPVAAMLLLSISFGASDYLHARLLSVGQSLWDNYGLIRHGVPQPTCNPNPDIDALVKQRVAAAEARQASADDLLPPAPPNPAGIRASLTAARDQCRQHFRYYQEWQKVSDSGTLHAFSITEGAIGEFTIAGLRLQPYFLLGVILLCAAMASVTRQHIAIRGSVTRLDVRVGAVLQTIAGLLLLYSAWDWRGIAIGGSGGMDWLGLEWVIGFALVAVASAWPLIRPPDVPPGGHFLHALRAVPLYTYMTLIAAAYFLFMEAYPAGIAVQISRMLQYSDLYLAVALYIWVGVLLKHTRLTQLIFEVLRPWNLAPELITIIVVLIAAIPTAFTGASGIFVLALGGVIYDEIRIAGARRQLAMAATAMSGSMGVVLNPCLMVVIITALNKQVTTDQLYGWGDKVFLLSAAIFSLVTLLARRNPITLARPREALAPSLRALRPLLPYAIITAVVILAFSLLLRQHFNEFSAPTILPVVLLGILACDRWLLRRDARRSGESPPAGFWPVVREATAESTVHIGSLLLLMALSVAIGGVVERSEIMQLFSGTVGSVWLATLLITVTLVIIGMFIDPYGAIILVSTSIAGVAYHNGITPLHFWMIVLVAFELGYLMPPVALNHLLARQSIGEQEFERLLAERPHSGFWRRHEHVLMPILVMGSSLLIVAFAPLLFG